MVLVGMEIRLVACLRNYVQFLQIVTIGSGADPWFDALNFNSESPDAITPVGDTIQLMMTSERTLLLTARDRIRTGGPSRDSVQHVWAGN